MQYYESCVDGLINSGFVVVGGTVLLTGMQMISGVYFFVASQYVQLKYRSMDEDEDDQFEYTWKRVLTNRNSLPGQLMEKLFKKPSDKPKQEIEQDKEGQLIQQVLSKFKRSLNKQKQDSEQSQELQQTLTTLTQPLVNNEGYTPL